MARVVDEMPSPSRAGSRPKYPWDEWLDGRTWLLEHGVDFEPDPEVFRRVVGLAAKTRGKRAVVRKLPEGLYIQAVER